MENPLRIEPYLKQRERWPRTGRHILASYDASSVIVYQAYGREIGEFASKHGYFGGSFSYSRMSWIKTNFLWMMYRSGWGTKINQEITLAIRISRPFFEEILSVAVPSSYDTDLFPSRAAWEKAVNNSDVRLQWDPDHTPDGQKEERRAIQLGLRGEMLERYGKRETLEILNLTDFVARQRENTALKPHSLLETPHESPYLPNQESVSVRLGLGA